MPTVLANEEARRELASAVKRLRVAVTSDAGRTPELADALVRVTSARLDAWAFTEAASDAPESVVLAARILAQGGAAGPYAELADAVRFFTASAQLAAVQALLGLAEAAGRTLTGMDAWREQLGRLQLVDHLSAQTAVWALVARARSLLGEPALANAYADAAAARRYAAPLPAPQAIAVHLLVADCRWAGGRPDEALAQHRLALDEHAALVAEVPGRPRPAVLATLTATAAAAYEPYALRLEALGQRDVALGVRRAHLALLERLDAEPTDALAWLAAGLRRAGRTDEAAGFAAPTEIPDAAPPPPGAPASWTRLSAPEALSTADPGAGYAALDAAVRTAAQAAAQARASAEAAEQQHRQRALELARERAATEAAAAERADAAAARAEAERQARERAEAEAAAAKRAADEAAARKAAEEHRNHTLAAQLRAARLAAAAAGAELADARAAVRAEHPDPAHRARALDRLAATLRPLAALEAYRDELAEVLETLVGLRWQLGEADASREAARELKALAGLR